MEIRGDKHCIAVTNGKACPGYRYTNSRYCYPHDPAISRTERRANAARGGHAGRGKRRFNLRTPKGVERCISLTLNGIFNRIWEPLDPEMDLRLAKAMTSLIRASILAIDLRKDYERTA